MPKNTKVAIIGAGNVGATLGMRILESGLADVVLLDVLSGIPQGKALDLMHAAPLAGHDKTILGTNNYEDIRDSDIVVITAGLPRKPGMSREELIAKNAGIVKDVVSKVKVYCPNSILIIVTNPLDTMTYLAQKITGFPHKRVMGMAGTLDVARLKSLICKELQVPSKNVDAMVLGCHGDTMVPILNQAKVGRKKLSDLLSKDKLEELSERTKNAGGEVVSLLGSGSAFFAPSAACFVMLKSIIKNEKKVMPISAYVDGQYGIRDLYIGVPCVIGKNGIEKIVELDLNEEEREALNKSAESIRQTLKNICTT